MARAGSVVPNAATDDTNSAEVPIGRPDCRNCRRDFTVQVVKPFQQHFPCQTDQLRLIRRRIRPPGEGAIEPRRPSPRGAAASDGCTHRQVRGHQMSGTSTIDKTIAASRTKPASFNLMRWIRENEDKLRPPTAAHTIFTLDDFIVSSWEAPISGRTIMSTREKFFFQLKGDITLRIRHEGKPSTSSSPRARSTRCPETCRTLRCSGRYRWLDSRACPEGWLPKRIAGIARLQQCSVREDGSFEVLERDMPPISKPIIPIRKIRSARPMATQ